MHVLGVDDEESTEQLLCLGKRAGGGGNLAAADADGPCRLGPLQGVRGDVVAAPSDLLRVLDRGVGKGLPLLLGHRVERLFAVVDRELNFIAFSSQVAPRDGESQDEEEGPFGTGPVAGYAP